MAATADALLVGGRYRMGAIVSQMQTGVFLAALDRKTGNPVQIHRVDGPPGQDLKSVRTQARVVSQRLAGLRHRNLPRVYDLVEEGNSVYSIQEEFNGQPLSNAVLPIDSEMVRRYLEQLLSALSYLHAQTPAIIHRDVRLETILVAPHGTLLLIGADVARVGAAAMMGTVHRGEGSAEYAAPEQLLGEPSNAQQDLYSAGAVAYHLASGQAPPPSLKRMKGVQLPALPASVPQRLASVITALLELEPEKRPVSAAAALTLLHGEEAAPARRLPGFLLPPEAPPRQPKAPRPR